MSIILLQTSWPSLNLAQSIMLYAYQLSPLLQEKAGTKKAEANASGFRVLKERTSKLLLDLKFKEESAIFPRIQERLNILGESDIHLHHSICNKYFDKMSNS